MPPERAPLVEIFHSIQGEGRFLGEPMVFLRVAVCPIRCLYCDTPHSYVASARFPVRRGAAAREEPNPVDAARAARLVAEVEQSSCYGSSPQGQPPRVSITGGEPLLYPGFVRALGMLLRPEGWRLHLETAALDAEALGSCLAEIDHLSADWKLPETLSAAPPQPTATADSRQDAESSSGSAALVPASLPPGTSLARGRALERTRLTVGAHEAQHMRCMALAVRAGKSVDVKVVLTPALTWESYGRALAALADLRSGIVLVLQPVTPFGSVTQAPAPDLVAECARRARAAGYTTRVMPQAHKQLGVE